MSPDNSMVQIYPSAIRKNPNFLCIPNERMGGGADAGIKFPSCVFCSFLLCAWFLFAAGARGFTFGGGGVLMPRLL